MQEEIPVFVNVEVSCKGPPFVPPTIAHTFGWELYSFPSIPLGKNQMPPALRKIADRGANAETGNGHPHRKTVSSFSSSPLLYTAYICIFLYYGTPNQNKFTD